MIKKILIFTSLILSSIFVYVYKYNDFDINNVVTTFEESNSIKLVKNGTSSKSVSIKAQFNSNVTAKKVIWSIAWYNSRVTDNINDYVSISSSSDTLTCNVYLNKSFVNRIVLTCTYYYNTSIKATATIHYLGREIANYAPEYDYFLDDEFHPNYCDFGYLYNECQILILDYAYLSQGGSLGGEVYIDFTPYFTFYFSEYVWMDVDLADHSLMTLYELLVEYCNQYAAPLDMVQYNLYNCNLIGFELNYSIIIPNTNEYLVKNQSAIFWVEFPWDYFWG